MFGAKLSTGSVDAICRHASDLFAGPYRQLQDWIRAQDALHVDETGWRTAGDSRALWTLSAPGASIFQIAEHCNREQFDELIGPFGGIVISDRWPGYEHLNPDRRQVCWSHLQRDFRRHSEGLAEQKTFGEHGLKLTRRVFAAWRAREHCAARSSTENSRTGPARTTANDSPNASSPPRRHAANSAAPYSTT
jgi:transposase